MSKIISVNAGSSSLKFQLFEMDDETVITSGVIERIGLEDSIFTINSKSVNLFIFFIISISFMFYYIFIFYGENLQKNN